MKTNVARKDYLVEVGFNEPTIIYEVTYKPVRELQGANIDQICSELDRLKAKKLLFDAAHPDIIERFRIKFIVEKIMRRPPQDSQKGKFK